MFIGPDEVAQGVVLVKDMATGQQTKVQVPLAGAAPAPATTTDASAAAVAAIREALAAAGY